MQEKTEKTWPRFVRTPEAARLLDLSPRTLEKHRCDGTGPVYHKLGGRVVYAVADIEAWIEACAHRPASDVASNADAPQDSAAARAICAAR